MNKEKFPINYDSPTIIRAFLEAGGGSVQKRFGQNFLINPDARRLLIDSLHITQGDHVWEIGAGLGAMTKQLLDCGAIVTAFEIDRMFCNILRSLFSSYENFFLVEGNVQNTWRDVTAKAKDLYLLGNLPYNIAASIIANFIENNFLFKRIIITVQKEVADRIVAKPCTKQYSSLSVLCASAYNVKPLSVFKSEYFYPKPNVLSQPVLFNLRDDASNCTTPYLQPVVRALFSARRKTIKNNLTAFLNNPGSLLYKNTQTAEEILNQCKLDSKLRAENLTLEDFIKIAKTVSGALE